MAIEQKTVTPPEYFNSIALGLPGGGFRAAAFCLGILKMLDEVNLLNNVKAISSVSGGSITAAKYVTEYAKKKDFVFNDFYNEMYNYLYDNTLLEKALENFNRSDNWPEAKRKSLINAFSLEYKSFIKDDYETLRNNLKANNKPLEDFIINATDFDNGHAFRFRTATKGPYFGNSDYRVPEHINKKVNLADAVAASSCFPGGFEPIEFPRDFLGTDSCDTDENLNPIGLMDGGIIDNQGSSSFLTTDELKYDCYLIADAGNYKIDGFDFSSSKFFDVVVQVLSSKLIFSIVLLLMILLPIYIGHGWILVLTTFIFTILFLMQGLLLLIEKKAHKIVGRNLLGHLKMDTLATLVKNRINSLVTLNASIFLKSSKASNIDKLFKITHYKISKLSIYNLELHGNNFKHLKKVEDLRMIGLEPSCDLYEHSKDAINFDTTLWFPYDSHKKKKLLGSLIDTGRAVCCQGLIKNMSDQTKFNKKVKLKHDDLKNDEFLKSLILKWTSLKEEIGASKNNDQPTPKVSYASSLKFPP